MIKTNLKNKLRLQLSEDMREFAIINNLAEHDVIKIRDNISNFVSINEVINYQPPKYIPNWDDYIS